MAEDDFFADYNGAGPFTLYVHIPFCVKRCRFCHFVTRVGAPQSEVDRYMSALIKEVDLYKSKLSLEKIPTDAICIGGGTATHMTPVQLDNFLEAFASRLDLSHCSQFTIDTDPTTILGDAGRKKLKSLRQYGANRITIGAQVFDNELLKKMNRAHTAEDTLASIDAARSEGFENICVDLIYGYPEQSLESWITTMEQILTLDIKSFQIYHLRIHPQSFQPGPIWQEYQNSPKDFPTVKEILLMRAISFIMTKNSSYADNQYSNLYSRQDATVSQYHEKRYCKLYDCLAFGFAANNELGGNIGIKEYSDIERYCSQVEAGHIPIVLGHKRDEDTFQRRAIIGSLRNHRAIYKKDFESLTGKTVREVFGKKLDTMINYGIFKETVEGFELTPRGYFFADAACLHFFHPDFNPFPAEDYKKGILSPYSD